MTNNNPFYICEKYYLLIYETKENAVAAPSMAAAAWPEYWSKELNSRVSFSNPNEPIFLVKNEGKYWNVIIGERGGWIIVEDWLRLKALVMCA